MPRAGLAIRQDADPTLGLSQNRIYIKPIDWVDRLQWRCAHRTNYKGRKEMNLLKRCEFQAAQILLRQPLQIGLILTACLLGGCPSQSGVTPNGAGGYLISKQAATGFPGLGNLKAEAMQEASQYCASQGREFVLTSAKETQPPYLLGNFPRTEIEFRCSETRPLR